VVLLERYLKTALKSFPLVVLVWQTGKLGSYVMERRVHAIFDYKAGLREENTGPGI
jgi:hypothetical protein